MDISVVTNTSKDRRVKLRFPAANHDISILVGVGIALIILTGIPYLYGYLSAPPDRQFMGILLNVPDTVQYWSWARESSHAILIENKLTPEHGDAVYVNLLWLLVGRLASVLGLGIAATVQLVRPVALAFFLGAIFWFIGLVTRDRLHRWLSFLTVVIGGGLGWIFLIPKLFGGSLAFPQDIQVYESNTFLTIMAFPHQAVADALLVSILGITALAFERNSHRLAIVGGLLGLVLGLQHGYDLVIVYVVLGLAAVVLVVEGRSRYRPLVLYATLCAVSGPGALYLFLITRLSPIWRGVLAQYGNAGIFSPDPFHLVLVMGIPLILIMCYRPATAATRPLVAREVILSSWLVAGCLVIYLPTNFQIKLLGGWQIPIGIVAARIVIDQIVPAFQGRLYPTRWRWDLAACALFLLTILPTNVYLYTWRLVDLSRHEYPYYLSRDDLSALRWIEINSKSSDVVLSSLTIGQYVPTVTGDSAFLAHWAETLDFYNKEQMVAQFFNPSESEVERATVLRHFDVRYVFFGEPERSLGAYNPDQSPELRLVFYAPGASVYEVQR